MSEKPLLVSNVLNVVSALLTTILLALGAWLGTQVVANGKSIESIRSNYAKATDLAELRAIIAAMPQEAPPSWFREEVRDIEIQLQRISDKLDAHIQTHSEGGG